MAILLTPPGGAAIAVVRLVGDEVGAFFRTHFDKPVPAGRCVHGTLTDGARVLDDPVVVTAADGRAADMSLHGGAWVVRSVLELARRAGFEVVANSSPALPDEALDADDALSCEVLSYLPAAQTELAVRALLAQGAAWAELRKAAVPADELRSMLADRSLHWLLHPPTVAIVGAPNVGKSTLANRLFARDRSIVADAPGTTRDWVGESANLDGLAVVLVDTPGVRETGDPIEREAIRRSREAVRAADLVVLVLDQSRVSEDEQRMTKQFPTALRVVNKSDRARAWDAAGEGRCVRSVATTGDGVDELRRVIRQHFVGAATFDVSRARWWTQRQEVLLRRAISDPAALAEI